MEGTVSGRAGSTTVTQEEGLLRSPALADAEWQVGESLSLECSWGFCRVIIIPELGPPSPPAQILIPVSCRG